MFIFLNWAIICLLSTFKELIHGCKVHRAILVRVKMWKWHKCPKEVGLPNLATQKRMTKYRWLIYKVEYYTIAIKWMD